MYLSNEVGLSQSHLLMGNRAMNDTHGSNSQGVMQCMTRLTLDYPKRVLVPHFPALTRLTSPRPPN